MAKGGDWIVKLAKDNDLLIARTGPVHLHLWGHTHVGALLALCKEDLMVLQWNTDLYSFASHFSVNASIFDQSETWQRGEYSILTTDPKIHPLGNLFAVF